jgi:cysteine sulfinate desulfinase/cysteine desulfurase-like protein
VLAAIGLNPAEINSSIRLSLGRFNDEAQIDAAADQIVESALKLQKLQSCP